QSIDVPILGEVPVEGRSVQEIEGLLVDRFRREDFLLNPRVLVRSLDSPQIKAYVSGAVSRAGVVELSRTDPSVYAAIRAAGGLKKSSGTQLAVPRRSGASPNERAAPEVRAGGAGRGVLAAGVGREGGDGPGGAPSASQRANSVDVLSVPTQSS